MNTSERSAPGADSIATGMDAFLAWADERGTPLSRRAAHAVLTLLAMHGARRRAGFPEPTAELVGVVLHESLPRFVAAAPEEFADYPAVLTALADRTRQAGLLNAKQRDRMLAKVAAATTEFERLMADPQQLTWPRLYAGLLRADGVSLDDATAVRHWLREFQRRPRTERRATVTSALGGGHPMDDTDIVVRQRTALAAGCTENAVLSLHALLYRAVDRDLTRRLSEGPAAPTGRGGGKGGEPALLPIPMDGAVDAVEYARAVADALADRWTAAGLGAALRGEFWHLAPLPAQLPGNTFAHELARLYHQTEGEEPPGSVMPPVSGVPAAGELPGLLRSAPLPAAAARLARWVEERGGVDYRRQSGKGKKEESEAAPVPQGADLAAEGELLGIADLAAVQEVWGFAVDCDLLRLVDREPGTVGGGPRIRAVAGDALQVWADGTVQEVAELALHAVGGYLWRLPESLADRAYHAGAKEEYETVFALAEDLPYTLLLLYMRCAPDSLARMAAVDDLWVLPDDVEDQDPAQVDDAGDRSLPVLLRSPDPRDREAGTSLLPPAEELIRLLGFDDLDEEDRAELSDTAHWLALLLDRLAAVGLVDRAGDRVALTPLGVAVLRDALRLGAVQAPTMAEVADLDARVLVAAAPTWPQRVIAPAITAWLARRLWSATAWRELLTAIAARHGTREADMARGLFGLLGVRPQQHRDSPHWSRPEHRLPVPLPQEGSAPQTAAPEAALCAALSEAVGDPVIGEYAAQALRQRGVEPPAEPSAQARAVLLIDRLTPLVYEELWRSRRAEPAARAQVPPEGTALCAAFDAAALQWPGGAGRLLPALTEADPFQAVFVLESLAEEHPERAVAAHARALLPQARTSRTRSRSAGSRRKRPKSSRRHRR